MKTKILAAALVLSLGFNLAVVATFGHHWLAQGGFERPHKMGSRHRKMLRKTLNLTDEQAKFMEANREELQKAIEPLRGELEKKRGELFALLDADAVDNAKLDKLIGDLSLLQMKIERAVIGNSITVRNNLTPEQREKFKEFLKKGPRKGPHGPGMMRGGGPFAG